jgi:hypothetical protein
VTGFSSGGASFCHHCFKQLQWKPGGGFYFVRLLTPHDRYPVRVHAGCEADALTEGYAKS